MNRKLMLLDSEVVRVECLEVAQGQVENGYITHIEESLAFQAWAVIGALAKEVEDLAGQLAAGDEDFDARRRVSQKETVQ